VATSLDGCGATLLCSPCAGHVTDAVDVLIVGAGPSGSEFAYRMARLGHRVLVLERDALDREKPCGGGIQTQELRQALVDIQRGDAPDPHNWIERIF